MSAPIEEGFVVASRGLEDACMRELAARVYAVTREEGGIRYRGKPGVHRTLNLSLATASRVYLSFGRVSVRDEAAFERELSALPLRALVGKLPTGIQIELHEGGGLHKGKLARAARAALGAPEGDASELVLLVHRGSAEVLLDTSGEHLHKRGYRQEISRAPLRETIAAGMLEEAGWTGETPLFDPMCGSGTILIEGALRALGRPPGLSRTFAFESFGGFDREGFAAEKAGLEAAVKKEIPPIIGSDLNAGALGVARRNAKRAGVFERLSLERKDATKLSLLPHPPGLVAANLPFGERVGDASSLPSLYRAFGESLAVACPGWTAALLVEDERLIPSFKLASPRVVEIDNGGLHCRLAIGRVGASR